MTAAAKGPIKGSGAHLALVHLEKMGGAASVANLMLQLIWTDTPGQFRRLVLGPLDRREFVRLQDEQISLTTAGKKFLSPTVDAAALAAPAGSYVAPARPLSVRHRPVVLRPGAFDYRDIPSLYAGKPVAFRSSITMHHEDNNG